MRSTGPHNQVITNLKKICRRHPSYRLGFTSTLHSDPKEIVSSSMGSAEVCQGWFFIQSRDRTYLSLSISAQMVQDTPAALMVQAFDHLPSRHWHLWRVVHEMVDTGWIIMDREIDILSDSESAVGVMWTAYFAGYTKSVRVWVLRRERWTLL